jgi:hypothetical protein
MYSISCYKEPLNFENTLYNYINLSIQIFIIGITIVTLIIFKFHLHSVSILPTQLARLYFFGFSCLNNA